jgi:hypothetical protein
MVTAWSSRYRPTVDLWRPKSIRDPDLKRLTRLGERTIRQNANPSEELPLDFLEWQTFSGRRDWKLGWWDLVAEFAIDAVKKAKQSYGVIEPNDFVNVKKGGVRAQNWLLLFRLPGGTDVRWMYVDFIIKVSRSDKVAFDQSFPIQAVQANSPGKYRPPFKIDRAFRSAFKNAIKGYGAERIESRESLRPPKMLLNQIAKNMRTVT